MHTKLSVICTHCTSFNTTSAGSTPGLNRVSKGKTQKIYGANAPQLHHIWPQAAPGAISPLSIKDGEGVRGKKDMGYLYKGPLHLLAKRGKCSKDGLA